MTLSEELKQSIDQILSFDITQLAKRTELGEINFEQGLDLLKKTHEFYKQLEPLPIELLPEDILQQINNATKGVANQIASISSFSIRQPNAEQARNKLLDSLKTSYDAAFKVTAQWMSYLKMEGEEASAALRRIETSMNEVEKNAHAIEEMKSKLENIVSAAQDAAAKVGVAHHATRFGDVAKTYGKQAFWWLIAASFIAVLTIFAAFLLVHYFAPVNGFSDPATIQRIISKLVIISVLLTAMIWTLRNYRALKHLQVSNEHRQHALGTFETFAQAAGDPETRNAVLMETTRSIFQFTSSGFIPSDDANLPSTKIFEVVKNLRVPNE